MKKKQSLDRGLDFLFEDNSIEDEQKLPVSVVPLSEVEPNREQPRKLFDKEKLEELAGSIAEHGLLQPIIVRLKDERFEIISGERRWRACRMAGVTEIPVIIRDIDDRTALEIALIENLQREDLNAVEEAQGYKNLMEEFGMTQEEVSKRVGKSRPAVANSLRILALPEKVLSYVTQGRISSGHARALLPLMEKKNNDELIALAEEISNKDITVRQVEDMAKNSIRGKPITRNKQISQDRIYYDEIETDISKSLGRKVRITKLPAEETGKIELEFYSTNDFEALIETLKELNK